jgi:dihydrofolate reductase
MQAPGSADEDTRDGFSRGGWAAPYSEETMGKKMGERMSDDYAWLFGRRSYEGLLAAWNVRGGPFKDALNHTAKYVVSSRPSAELDWPNSTLLTGDVPAAVADLKDTFDGNLVIMGSGVLIRSLIAAGLIDEYLLMIAPLVLGCGRRLFSDGVQASLRLLDCTATNTGAIVASYEPLRSPGAQSSGPSR